MIPLLDGLAVEVRGELREVLAVVVHGDRDVLLRRRELVPDLTVERLGEGRHGADSTDQEESGSRSPYGARPAIAVVTRLASAPDGVRHPMSFDDHVRPALDELPPELAAALTNVAVVVEDENPEDPDLFGLYHGVPLPERGDMAGMPPDTISIYRIPLEESFPDPEELREEIRITVLHELAHYFGLDEDRLAELGYD